MMLRNICLLFFLERYAKKLETVITASAIVMSLLITLPAPNDQANSSNSLYT